MAASLRNHAPGLRNMLQPILGRLPWAPPPIQKPLIEPAGSRPRLLIDVTATANMPLTLGGIQRTVRQLAAALQRPDADYPFEPIPVRLIRQNRELILVTAKGFPQQHCDGPLVAIRPGDILLMLDATWNLYPECVKSVFPIVRAQNGKIITCVYDVLPITHPQFFTKQTLNIFEPWIAAAMVESDALIAISQTTLSDLIKIGAINNRNSPRLEFFHLGADFSGSNATSETREYSTQQPIFLMVGTIEPRKGHATVLDAFETLWAEGFTGRLEIVGRKGWMVKHLMRRMNKLAAHHPTRFTYHSNASDATLQQCYHAASVIIAASEAEGFGLPIIEAMMLGKPVIASDIAAFREVAGETPLYFRPRDAASLAAAVRSFSSYNPAAQRPTWLTWDQSSDTLMNCIQRCIEVVPVV
jgi:glycosyltransferase involved in cell wall biosynthesis